MIYLVIKEGVYRHEVVGLYDSEDSAKGEAMRFIMAEPDDYHAVVVCKGPLNTQIKDVDEIYTLIRKGGVVSAIEAEHRC